MALFDFLFGGRTGAPGAPPPDRPHWIQGRGADAQLDPSRQIGGGQYGQQGFQGLRDFTQRSAAPSGQRLRELTDLYGDASQSRLGTLEAALMGGASGGRRGVRDSDLETLRDRSAREDVGVTQGLASAFNRQAAGQQAQTAGLQESLMARLPGLGVRSQAVPQANADLFASEYNKYLEATDRNTGLDWRRLAAQDFGRG